MLVRFDRTGPESGLIWVGSFDQNRLQTSDSEPMCRIRIQIRNLYGLSGVTGAFLRRVTRGSAFWHVQTGPVRNAEPRRNSAQKNPNDPGPTLYDSEFCVDSESGSGFGISARKRELEADSDRNFRPG